MLLLFSYSRKSFPLLFCAIYRLLPCQCLVQALQLLLPHLLYYIIDPFHRAVFN